MTRAPRTPGPPRSPDARRVRARKNAQHLEVLAGLVGAFALALLVGAVWTILTGRPSAALSLVLLLVLALLAVTVLAARRQRARAGSPPARTGRDRTRRVERRERG